MGRGLTLAQEVLLIEILRTLLIRVSRVWRTHRFRKVAGRKRCVEHVQRNVKRSPGAASATRLRSSRSYRSPSPISANQDKDLSMEEVN